MRQDVLEAMADELLERAAHPLASFSTWEEGRRRLDGMQSGKRWDLEREQREWDRQNRAELTRIYKRAWLQRWRAANPGKNREYDRAAKARLKKRLTAKIRAQRRARNKRWEMKNRARYLVRRRATAQRRYAANPAPEKARVKRYQAKNRDAINVRRRQLYREKKEG